MKNSTLDYELTIILGEKANPEDGKAKSKEVTAVIEKLGGKVTKEEHWGRRELAYVIKRNRSGFYITFWLTIPSKGLPDLERHLGFDEAVIRFLTTKAYTSAQPGSLYPVVEEEKGQGKDKEKDKEESATAEEQLRRSTKAPKKEAATEAPEDIIPEDERKEKVDEALEQLLKDEE